MQLGSPDEERQRGSVKKGLYVEYLRAWGPAFIVPILFILFSMSEEALDVRFTPSVGYGVIGSAGAMYEVGYAQGAVCGTCFLGPKSPAPAPCFD